MLRRLRKDLRRARRRGRFVRSDRNRPGRPSAWGRARGAAPGAPRPRRPGRARAGTRRPGRIDDGALDGVDAVVSLGGVGIARPAVERCPQAGDPRLRKVPTEVLATAVARARRAGHAQRVGASGYYGDTGDRRGRRVDAVGQRVPRRGLPRLGGGRRSRPATAGARVVTCAPASVLSPSGGLLGPGAAAVQAFPRRADRLGRQYMPWVSLDDEVGGDRVRRWRPTGRRARSTSTGPVPVTNAEFTTALAAAVAGRRRCRCPRSRSPRCSARWAEEMLLTGQRAVPAALLDAGYQFRHHTVGDALSAAVGPG